MAHDSENKDSPNSPGYTIEVVPSSRWNAEETPVGIRSSSIGSFMPDGGYRPMPMTWLVAAWTVHNLAMILLVMLLSSRPLFFTISTTAVASLWIGNKTFEAGMAKASNGWKIALVLALLVNWGLATMISTALVR